MKLQAHQVEGFCANPSPEPRAILLYGPDQGLVAERFEQISLALASDLDDPFQVVSLDGDDVASDMVRFLDEAAQISLDGTRRVIRIRHAGDSVTTALESFLDSGGEDAVVLVQGGDLGPRSGLRKLFERAKGAAAAPCYADDSRTIERLLRDVQEAHRLKIDPDAYAYLVVRLGRDRGVTRNELEKLVLFAGDGGTLDYEAAAALSGDNAMLGADALADAVGLGRAGDAFRAFRRLHEEGLSEIAVIRRLLRHFQSLHIVTAAADPLQAVRSLQPPVHFKRKAAVEKQARQWSTQRVEHVLRLLGRAEETCKRTGTPGREVVRETVLRIARIAGP